VVYRYSWIAGLASIGFAYWQLGRLLLATGSGAKWQLVVLSGLAIGIILTWTAVTYRLKAWWIALINAGALVLAATRFSAPSQTILVIPMPAAFASLWADLDRAFDLIRHGVEPVRPIPGVVMILTALFWLLGSLLAWGLSKDHPFVAVIPPLIIGIQMATLDRRSESPLVITVFVLLVAATALAVSLDERERGAGRMSGTDRRTSKAAASPTAAVLMLIIVTASVAASGWLGPKVPADGYVDWRTPGGLSGGFFGSVTYNPYVQIHNGLVSQEGIPLFRATIDGDVSPDKVYFRLLTMDIYRNGQWAAGRPQVYVLGEGPPETKGQEFAGATGSVVANVEILGLSQEWLPAPYAVNSAGGEDAEAFRIRRADTALFFRGDSTYRGMQYQVTSKIPIIKPETVAGNPNGGLSPLFAAAALDGKTIPESTPIEPRDLPDPDRYTDLPTGMDPRIRAKAADLTRNLTTPFEKGLAIEHWFRESGGFVYDVDTETGHSEDVLATWLFDDSEGNPGYRRGYCEQFATSMAVMTRSIGIPTRVVLGFTPGVRVGLNEVEVQDKNAHSWVELWIPNAGWVSFDPTPRSDGANPVTSYGTLSESLGYDIAPYLDQIPEPVRPAINESARPPGGIFADDTNRPETPFFGSGGETTASTSVPGWLRIAVMVIILMVLALIAVPLMKWARHRSRMRRLTDGDISAAWEEIVARLSDLGMDPNPASTPVEVAGEVDAAMMPLATVYSRSIYGHSLTDPGQQVDAARRSMEATSERLATRYSPTERLRSQYRLRSLLRRFRK